MAHASFSLTALNVLLFHTLWLVSVCFFCLVHKTQIILPVVLLVLSTFHKVVPSHDVSQSPPFSTCSLPSLYCAVCSEMLGSPLTAQNCKTRCSNFLRGLNWKMVRETFLPANPPPGWSWGTWALYLLEGIPPHLESLVSCHPGPVTVFISHYRTSGVLPQCPLNCGWVLA